MKSATLSALKADGTVNIVEITNRKLDTQIVDGKETNNPTKFSIPAEQFEYPVPENWDDVYQSCGGQDRALEIFVETIRDAAVTEGKNSIRMASAGTQEDIIKAGLAKTRNFTFIEQARVTAAEAKEKFGNLKALASEQNLSDADLAAAVRKMLGL